MARGDCGGAASPGTCRPVSQRPPDRSHAGSLTGYRLQLSPPAELILGAGLRARALIEPLLERLASLASGALCGQAALISQPNSIPGLSLVRRKSQAAAKKHSQGPKRYDCLDCPSHSIHLHLSVLECTVSTRCRFISSTSGDQKRSQEIIVFENGRKERYL